MNISDCHGDRRPLTLKLVSRIALITFFAAQCDVQLAFGFNTPQISLSRSLPGDPDIKHDDIHHMSDPYKLDSWLLSQTQESLASEEGLFTYGLNEMNQPFVRIHTRANGADELGTYQTFSVDYDGRRQNLLEVGIVIAADQKDNFIVQKKYDVTGRSVTIYDPLDAEFRKVFQLDEHGAAQRVLEYRKGEVHIKFNYDDVGNTVTLTNEVEGTFEVHKLEDGHKVGVLQKLGVIDTVESDRTLVVKQIVEISEIERSETMIPTYVFKSPGGSDNFSVYEKLPQGGVGRLLRVHGTDDGRLIDQEYFYDIDKESGKETVTILNYADGTFLKMEVVDKVDADNDGILDNPGILVESGVIMKGVQRELKSLLIRSNNTFESLAEDDAIRAVHEAVGNPIGRLLRERGPPAEQDSSSPSSFPFPIYFHDLSATNHFLLFLFTHVLSVNSKLWRQS